ncbi:DUF2201 family putative metallopeptidase [uncultured Pseudokineococcus sp.]|uniref:vWA domain-containing protein n=1 Tax=uncultured Pseudokineococcus sp. TaxID=1642928 RepID=UPI00260E9DA8|nr:VWA-like domain-containing protein [uncultured Pseudokineococcus sp.]
MSATITTRPLTADEVRALAAARLHALHHAPYFARALFAVAPLAAENLGTYAVDAHWRLYLDPTVLAEWSPEHSGAVLVHEVGHLVRDHAGRAAALGDVQHLRWNYATDAAINDDLIAAGIPLPGAPVTPEALGLPPGGIEETYYASLPSTDAPDPDDVGCGSGAGDPTAGWEAPPDDTTTPAMSPTDQHLTRQQTAHDVVEHARTRGTVPAGLDRWATTQLEPPTVPWRQVLAGAVRRATAHVAGAHDYTYARPGRRRLPGVVTPAMRRPRVNVAAVLDTSASMSPADVAAALAEVQGIVTATGHGADLRVLTCDAQAYDVSAGRPVRDAARLDLRGGGGTDMRVGITAALDSTPRPDVVVVLSDGFTPWPSAPTRARLVVALVSDNPEHAPPAPPWASTVHIRSN